jgi:hypothetical protein
MTLFPDLMFNETTARTSETQMLSGNGTTAGTYAPKYAGRLKKIWVLVTPQAATSLCQAGYVKLKQADWKPNEIIFPFNGFGLATAPQAIGGNELINEYQVDLPVATDKPIDSLLFENDSPVTPRIRVIGWFESSG